LWQSKKGGVANDCTARQLWSGPRSHYDVIRLLKSRLETVCDQPLARSCEVVGGVASSADSAPPPCSLCHVTAVSSQRVFQRSRLINVDADGDVVGRLYSYACVLVCGRGSVSVLCVCVCECGCLYVSCVIMFL